jgi:hypothetical protein
MSTHARSTVMLWSLALSACSTSAPSPTWNGERAPLVPVVEDAALPPPVADALARSAALPVLVVVDGEEMVCHASGCKPRGPSILERDPEIRALAQRYATVRLGATDGAAFVDARLEQRGEQVRLGPKQVIAGQPPVPGAFVLDEHGRVTDWVSLRGFDAQDNLRRLLAER